MKTRNLLNLSILTLAITACGSKNQSIDSSLPKLQSEMNDLNTTVTELEKHVKDTKNNKVAELEKKLQETESAKQKLQTDLDNKEREQTKLNTDIETLKNQITKLEEKGKSVDDLEKKLKQKEQEKEFLDNRVKLLQNDISFWQTRLEKITLLEKELKQAEEKKKEDLVTIAKLTKDLEDKNTELAGKKAELNITKTKESELNIEIEKKKEKIKELSDQIALLTASGSEGEKIVKLQNEVLQLKTDKQQAEEKKDELIGKIGELNGKINILSEEKNAKQEKIDELNGKIESLKDAATASQVKITELKGKISQLEGDVKEKEKAKKKAEDKVTELNDKIDELTREKDEKQNTINSLKGQIETLKETTIVSQTKISELQNKISQLEDVVSAKEQAKQQFADKVNELQSKVDELNHEKNRKNEEIEELKKKLKSQGDAELKAKLILSDKKMQEIMLALEIAELKTKLEKTSSYHEKGKLKRQIAEKENQRLALKHEILAAENGISEQEKEETILEIIKDKNDPRYKDLKLSAQYTGKNKYNNGNQDDDFKRVFELSKEEGKYIYKVFAGENFDKEEHKKAAILEFSSDDFNLMEDGFNKAEKIKPFHIQEEEQLFDCFKDGRCQEHQISDIKTALTKYKNGESIDMFSSAKQYICNISNLCITGYPYTTPYLESYSSLSSDKKEKFDLAYDAFIRGDLKANIDVKFNLKSYIKRGSDAVKLSYSDFGMFEKNIEVENISNDISDSKLNAKVNQKFKKILESDQLYAYYIQGIESLRARVKTDSDDMTFKGKTFALFNDNEKLTGDVKLDVKGEYAKGNLNLNFGNKLDINMKELDLSKFYFDSENLSSSGGNITATGNLIDGYNFIDGSMNLNMYGPHYENPTEAVGSYKFNFSERCSNPYGGCKNWKVKGVFGAKKE